jgi:hypothetical protein
MKEEVAYIMVKISIPSEIYTYILETMAFFVVCGLSIILGYFGETYFIYGAF